MFGCLFAVSQAVAAEPFDVAAGRRIAEQNCGGCHATAGGPSPLADAPPFRLLHLRYPPEGLGRLLQEGMIAPSEPRDEAPTIYHPRMPLTHLDTEQIDQLRTFLQSLEPR
jgi:mono/diheme cytochrome c family protein